MRIAAEYLDKLRPSARLWIGLPTWANHMNIFSQANVQIRHYDYLDKDTRTELDFESLVEALNESTEGDAFLFGPETRGLPQDVLESVPTEQRLRVPMQSGNRSLNLSNAAAVVLYEAWRQTGYEGGA